MRVTSLALALLAAGAAIPAHAATVTETYDFTLTNFVDINGSAPAPYDPVTGSFTLTFDPTVAYNDATSGLTVNSFVGGPVDSPFGFSTFFDGNGKYHISIGGTQTGTGFIQFGTNDFALQLQFDSNADVSAPTLSLCSTPGFTCGTASGRVIASGYTLAAMPNDAFLARVGSVPEPATWAMMIGGFGLAGGALRTRRRKRALA